MPAASQFNTSHTVMRNPRTHGWPERLPGSMVMRVLILRAYHRYRDEALVEVSIGLKSSRFSPRTGDRSPQVGQHPSIHVRMHAVALLGFQIWLSRVAGGKGIVTCRSMPRPNAGLLCRFTS